MHYIILLSLFTFLIIQTSALTAARVWTHFYPSCPGEPNTSLHSYESYEQSTPKIDLLAVTCRSVAVPSFHHNEVDQISIDAEIFWAEPFEKCNITVHEVPDCIDPPLIFKPIQHRIGVSGCEGGILRPFLRCG